MSSAVTGLSLALVNAMIFTTSFVCSLGVSDTFVDMQKAPKHRKSAKNHGNSDIAR
jgi:hypothetical protein